MYSDEQIMRPIRSYNIVHASIPLAPSASTPMSWSARRLLARGLPVPLHVILLLLPRNEGVLHVLIQKRILHCRLMLLVVLVILPRLIIEFTLLIKHVLMPRNGALVDPRIVLRPAAVLLRVDGVQMLLLLLSLLHKVLLGKRRMIRLLRGCLHRNST